MFVVQGNGSLGELGLKAPIAGDVSGAPDSDGSGKTGAVIVNGLG